MSQREGELDGVLSGVRVLDFGRYIAGPYCAALLDLSETPGRFRHRAPQLGEHTEAILSELGYQGPEIAGLRARGVI